MEQNLHRAIRGNSFEFFLYYPSLLQVVRRAAIEFKWLADERKGCEVLYTGNTSIRTLLEFMESSIGQAPAQYRGEPYDLHGLAAFGEAYNRTYQEEEPIGLYPEIIEARNDITAIFKQVISGAAVEEATLRRMHMFCDALEKEIRTLKI